MVLTLGDGNPDGDTRMETYRKQNASRSAKITGAAACIQRRELHPSLYPPIEGQALVAAELMADLVAKDLADSRQQIDQCKIKHQ
jgi:hypothetical protein